jgi:sulfur-carrier protein
VSERASEPMSAAPPGARSPARVTIRVVLPAHLRQLARCDREIRIDADPTLRGVIEALEKQYPALRGTLRDPATDRRRLFVRFYACEQDLSHESPDTALPAAVVTGNEPFLIIGAMAGG